MDEGSAPSQSTRVYVVLTFCACEQLPDTSHGELRSGQFPCTEHVCVSIRRSWMKPWNGLHSPTGVFTPPKNTSVWSFEKRTGPSDTKTVTGLLCPSTYTFTCPFCEESTSTVSRCHTESKSSPPASATSRLPSKSLTTRIAFSFSKSKHTANPSPLQSNPPMIHEVPGGRTLQFRAAAPACSPRVICRYMSMVRQSMKRPVSPMVPRLMQLSSPWNTGMAVSPSVARHDVPRRLPTLRLRLRSTTVSAAPRPSLRGRSRTSSSSPPPHTRTLEMCPSKHSVTPPSCEGRHCAPSTSGLSVAHSPLSRLPKTKVLENGTMPPSMMSCTFNPAGPEGTRHVMWWNWPSNTLGCAECAIREPPYASRMRTASVPGAVLPCESRLSATTRHWLERLSEREKSAAGVPVSVVFMHSSMIPPCPASRDAHSCGTGLSSTCDRRPSKKRCEGGSRDAGTPHVHSMGLPFTVPTEFSRVNPMPSDIGQWPTTSALCEIASSRTAPTKGLASTPWCSRPPRHMRAQGWNPSLPSATMRRTCVLAPSICTSATPCLAQMMRKLRWCQAPSHSPSVANTASVRRPLASTSHSVLAASVASPSAPLSSMPNTASPAPVHADSSVCGCLFTEDTHTFAAKSSPRASPYGAPSKSTLPCRGICSTAPPLRSGSQQGQRRRTGRPEMRSVLCRPRRWSKVTRTTRTPSTASPRINPRYACCTGQPGSGHPIDVVSKAEKVAGNGQGCVSATTAAQSVSSRHPSTRMVMGQAVSSTSMAMARVCHRPVVSSNTPDTSSVWPSTSQRRTQIRFRSRAPLESE
eukprot:Rhum_TRINITY_DN12193_c0_g1::Rhum_TRINITY_DN12193_c0_g1_i1::g.49861::m.49861